MCLQHGSVPQGSTHTAAHPSHCVFAAWHCPHIQQPTLVTVCLQHGTVPDTQQPTLVTVCLQHGTVPSHTATYPSHCVFAAWHCPSRKYTYSYLPQPTCLKHLSILLESEHIPTSSASMCLQHGSIPLENTQTAFYPSESFCGMVLSLKKVKIQQPSSAAVFAAWQCPSRKCTCSSLP